MINEFITDKMIFVHSSCLPDISSSAIQQFKWTCIIFSYWCDLLLNKRWKIFSDNVRERVGGGQLGVSARVGASLAALAGEEQQGGAEPAAGGPPPHPGHHQEWSRQRNFHEIAQYLEKASTSFCLNRLLKLEHKDMVFLAMVLCRQALTVFKRQI